MKTNIIVAAIAAVVSIVVWEGMHVISGVDSQPQEPKSNNQFVWRKHI